MEAKRKEKENNTGKIVLIVLGIICFSFILFLLYAGLVKQPIQVVEVRSVEEAYTTTEQFAEPYTTTECSEEMLFSKITDVSLSENCMATNTICESTENYCVGYGTKNGACKKWNFWGTVCAEYYQIQGDCVNYATRCARYSYPCSNYKYTCSVTIRNLDNKQGGTFRVLNKFVNRNNDNVKTEQKDLWISVADTNFVKFEYYTTSSTQLNCMSSVIAPYPTKQVCSEVVRTRYVDKQVVKTKIVDKENQVTKYYTLIEKWTGKIDYYYRV